MKRKTCKKCENVMMYNEKTFKDSQKYHKTLSFAEIKIKPKHTMPIAT